MPVEALLDFLGNPEWKRQHGWRRAIWRGMSRMGLSGLHAMPLNRRWVEIHRRDMPLVGLDSRFEGLKIVQMSDLHVSPVVWPTYLAHYIRWVNELQPQLVVITGDIITGGYRYAALASAVLSRLEAPLGVICTLGNHDYGFYGKHAPAEGERRADHLQKCLENRGLIVLRNQQFTISAANTDQLECRAGAQAAPEAKPGFTIVGLDDLWSGHLDPDPAFAQAPPGNPIICLNHNPANARELLAYPWQWMLSGHTHGRQLATTKLGKALYPRARREYTHGYYPIDDRHLYVNRGLSYGQRMRHWCRPEITVFKLRVA
jgi:predicted MPP superfamily phosphohydrolase